MKSIIDYIQQTIDHDPGHTALLFRGRKISYQQLFFGAEQAAACLLAHGLMSGSRVGYMLTPSPLFYQLFLGASMLGISCMGLNAKASSLQVEVFLNQNLPTLFIIDRALLYRLPHDLPASTTVILAEAITDVRITPKYRSAIDAARSQITPDTPLFEISTSGSTGTPKTAILTQENVLTSCLAQQREFGAPKGFCCDDVVQQLFPVNHVSGAVELGVAPLLCGSTVSIHDKFSPQVMLEDAVENHVTMLLGVPAMWEAMLHLPGFKRYDLSCVRWCGIGAAPAREETLRRIMDICGIVSNPLGATETSGFSTAFEGSTNWRVLSQSVGRVIPELEWKIIDADGQAVGTGETGQLAYRGKSVIKRYSTAPVKHTEDGYFLSGDLASADEAGYIYLHGRADDIFHVGGYNVSPQEIERLMLSYPGIVQALVVPVPHQIMGAVPEAVIVPSEGCTIDTDKLVSWLEDRLLYYKVPRRIHMWKSLPSNEIGKVSRRKVAAALAVEYIKKAIVSQ